MTCRTFEGVCPHCMRQTRANSRRVILKHDTYCHPQIRFYDPPPSRPDLCPGVGHKAVKGNPEIDVDPPCYCPL